LAACSGRISQQEVSPENVQTVRLLKTRLKRTLARLFLTLALWAYVVPSGESEAFTVPTSSVGLSAGLIRFALDAYKDRAQCL
jgi:hypothetical protein